MWRCSRACARPKTRLSGQGAWCGHREGSWGRRGPLGRGTAAGGAGCRQAAKQGGGAVETEAGWLARGAERGEGASSESRRKSGSAHTQRCGAAPLGELSSKAKRNVRAQRGSCASRGTRCSMPPCHSPSMRLEGPDRACTAPFSTSTRQKRAPEAPPASPPTLASLEATLERGFLPRCVAERRHMPNAPHRSGPGSAPLPPPPPSLAAGAAARAPRKPPPAVWHSLGGRRAPPVSMSGGAGACGCNLARSGRAPDPLT